jgi:pimeloyl-ACP methyl ester carboxylesterase
MPYATTPASLISYTISGPSEEVEDPQALLMIMGLAGSGAMWFRMLPHVARRHRAIVFDNRGTGGSSPAHRPLKMADMVGDAIAVLDAAGVQTAHVMGASMGGMIAQHLALEHRERVRSLLLACTTAGGRREPPNLRLTAAALMRPLVGRTRTFGLVAPALYSPRTQTEAPDRLSEDMRIRSADRVGALTPLMQGMAIAGHDTRSRLHELGGLPTLVVHGLDDRLVPPEHGRELANSIPGARLVEIPGAGHLLATDAEREVSTAVLDHIDGYGTAPATTRTTGSDTEG